MFSTPTVPIVHLSGVLLLCRFTGRPLLWPIIATRCRKAYNGPMRLLALHAKRAFALGLPLVLAVAQLAGQNSDSSPQKVQWFAGPVPPAPGTRGFTVLFENDQLGGNRLRCA